MPDLNHLKVDSMPAAFADLGRKHNELVELIASIQGERGVDVKIAHSAAKGLSVPGTSGFVSKIPRGKIMISVGGGAPTGSAQCIAYDGTIVSVVAAFSNTTNYPNYSRINGNGTALIINGTNINHNMSIVTVNVCVNGSPMNMDIIASAPY